MENARQLFKKLKIYTLLDLALITPTSYNDTTLSSSFEVGKIGTYEVTVKDLQVIKGKLRVNFRLNASGRYLSALFFRTTPYHHQLFTIGSHHYIQGRLEEYRGYLQMSQPKSIKEIGKITPQYKTVLKESEIRALIETYINEQNLYHEGLDSHEVATMMRIHFPQSIHDIYEKGSYSEVVTEVLKFVEAYNHIKKLRTKRIDYPALKKLCGDVTPFVTRLPFRLTDEQQHVIREIQEDLKQENKAAKRMVVGDVGSGKTMVILASVMIALPEKSILMAPTSLLALQLYEEACTHLPGTVKVALVMQGKDRGAYAEADFIIGTHALLYKEDLPDAALVMVDEQHRFGTQQRQSLEALVSKGGEKRAHYIQFSATPIPRTQAMLESELLDVSLITTTPFEKDITTLPISKQDFPDLLSHIKQEFYQ
ncbi:MAG TPA: DEAD/DEAH box helicase [Epsilonproteobacteria bacterium]|nr:DEAD/DEAH box helicase [Campylobacterota bacterium]